MRNIVIEGARGTGKSSITKYLRENTVNSTLINFTGFNVSGVEGLKMVVDYYTAWFGFFRNLRDAEGEMTFIHDRFFFSERVYANLYKDYANEFNYYYESFLNLSASTFDLLDVYFLVPTNYKQLERNLEREKVLFHNVEESVKKSQEQTDAYSDVFQEIIKLDRPKIRVTIVPLGDKSVEEIGDDILRMSGINRHVKL